MNRIYRNFACCSAFALLLVGCGASHSAQFDSTAAKAAPPPSEEPAAEKPAEVDELSRQALALPEPGVLEQLRTERESAVKEVDAGPAHSGETAARPEQPAQPNPAARPEQPAHDQDAASEAGRPQQQTGQSDGLAQPPADGGAATREETVERPKEPLLDVQAHYALEVESVEQSLERLQRIARERGGRISQESTADAGYQTTARVTLRIPVGQSKSAFDSIAKLGSVQSREVVVDDVTKDYYDAAIRLRNLELTLERYRQILRQATSVEDILKIEGEMARLRGEIESLKGQLRLLRDRTALATIHVQLTARSELDPVVIDPEARFFPGVRAGYTGSFTDAAEGDYFNLGFSIRAARPFSIDVDFLHDLGVTPGAVDGMVVTVGGELYSEFLGNGENRFFNPYLGLRAGYGRFGEDDTALGGVNLGLELIKSEIFWVEFESRFLGAGGDGGARFVVQPMLGVNVAF